MGSRELIEILKRIEEKLYAGWNLYIALEFLYWVPALNIYMAITSTAWFQNLKDYQQGILSITYWGAVIVLSAIITRTLLTKYVNRLSASLGKSLRSRCGVLSAISWSIAVFLSLALHRSLETVYGSERFFAAWFLLFVSVGTSGSVATEYCASRRIPLSIIAVMTSLLGLMLLPLTPRDTMLSMAFASSVVTTGYTLTAALYVARTLRRLG